MQGPADGVYADGLSEGVIVGNATYSIGHNTKVPSLDFFFAIYNPSFLSHLCTVPYMSNAADSCFYYMLDASSMDAYRMQRHIEWSFVFPLGPVPHVEE